MSDKKKSQVDELREAYEADKERRNVREDELQAAKDYLSVLLKEIETKNKELEDKKKEAENLVDALKKSEDEKKEEVKATREARESGRYKSIWIGIAITEFIAVIALVVSLFVVYNKMKDYYEDKLRNETEEPVNKEPEVTDVPEPEPETSFIISDLGKHLAEIMPRNSTENVTENPENDPQTNLTYRIDEFDCCTEEIDGLEYLVFSNDDGLKVCYKNEYYVGEKDFKKAVIVEKSGKRIYEHIEYDLNNELSVLCPKKVYFNNKEMLMLSDYAGFGTIPEYLRVYSYDEKTLKEFNGDDIHKSISKLMSLEFPDRPSGIVETPILMELTTTRINSATGKRVLYKYGLSESGYNEIGYSGTTPEEADIADITSEFRLTITESGISWKTVVKLGRKLYLGELKGELVLAADSVVIDDASFGAYAPANAEDPALGGVITPAQSIPEKYVTILGANSERFYISISDKVKECTYDWDRLNSDDANNWEYFDENGNKISVRGIDVSKYQDVIDWKEVAKAGIEFAIIRVGYRGMNEGTLELDQYFETNIKGAIEAGIKVGVYFFSQAINKKEALEEADFVIKALKGYEITYPVVFDTERVTTFNARANDLGYSERTDLCIAFCDKIAKAGYRPMIYANTKYMIMGVDLERLEKYDKWYACYKSDITFPYDFQMLQYSEKGTIAGIKGNVDLDISFVDYSKTDEKNG